MPSVENEMIFVSASSEKAETAMINAGTTPATSRATGGTCRRDENVASARLPKIMPSRPKEYTSRLAAACRLSAQDTNEMSTTSSTTREPVSPNAAVSTVVTG